MTAPDHPSEVDEAPQAGAGEAQAARGPSEGEEARERAESHERSESHERAEPRERAGFDFVRRLLEAGVEKLSERPDLLKQKLAELKLGDIKLTKEALGQLLGQLDDSKSSLYRLVAKEVREFLQSTQFTDELVRVLTRLSFEIRTEVRFTENESGQARPRVKSSVRVKTDRDDLT